MEGKKLDAGKNRLGLLPRCALYAIGLVLTFGARKYDPWNWAKGMDWSRVRDALDRHLFAYDDGDDYDNESGLLHLAHAGCCLLFLLTYQILGLGKDDRYDYRKKCTRHESRGTNPMGYQAPSREDSNDVQTEETQIKGSYPFNHR